MRTRGRRGIGGPAVRLVLAVFGLVACAAAAVMLALAGASYGAVAFFAVLAAIAVVDVVALARRGVEKPTGSGR